MENILVNGLFIISGLFLFIWFVMIYNKIVNYEQSSKSAYSSIGVELKKRSDLIPEVINSIKGFVKHEDQLFKHLTKLRSDINAAKKGNKQSLLNLDREFFKSVFAITEAYPNIRSSEAFLKLQDILERTEVNISASRHIYNSNIDYYNSYIQSFPSVIIAGLFDFKEKSYLEFDENTTERVSCAISI